MTTYILKMKNQSIEKDFVSDYAAKAYAEWYSEMFNKVLDLIRTVDNTLLGKFSPKD